MAQAPTQVIATPPADASAAEQFRPTAAAYINEHLAGILVMALKAVCRERPENPVDYVAMYLLKHHPQKQVTVSLPLSSTIPQVRK
jgi:hypothetical protein